MPGTASTPATSSGTGLSVGAPSLVAGVILAGGLSRRMGGGDKALLSLGASTMLDHVIRIIQPQVAALVLNANRPPERFAHTGLPVVADTVSGFVGPLAGILAGLRWAESEMPMASHVASVSSDAPFLPDDLVTELSDALEARSDRIVLAQSGGKLHPVIGLWPVSLADDLEAALESGVRKVLHWTDRHDQVSVTFSPRRIGEREIDPFFNANTPEDMEEARLLLETSDAEFHQTSDRAFRS